MPIAMAYGSLNLQANGMNVSETDIYNGPEKSIQAERLSEADGSVMVKTTYESKTFTIAGQIRASTIAVLDAYIDSIKAGLYLEKQNFDMDWDGGIRRYVATAKNLILSRERGMNIAGFSVEFFCESPVGMAVSTSTLISSTVVSSSTAQLPLTVLGSYMAEPVVTVTVASVTGGTAKTISLTNNTNLRGIRVTRNWVNGDVLEVDSLNKTVFVNNVPVAFGGTFPKWDPGAGALGYLDDFTTRSVSVSSTYTRRYL